MHSVLAADAQRLPCSTERELGGPTGRDRTTGIADQADLLCSRRSAGGRVEHRTQRESVSAGFA
jgi:hypothetical protein